MIWKITNKLCTKFEIIKIKINYQKQQLQVYNTFIEGYFSQFYTRA